MQITPVHPFYLIKREAEVIPLLDSALEPFGYRYKPTDVLIELLRPNTLWQAWLIHEGEEIIAIAISQIVQFPQRRGLCIFAIGGTRMDEWLDDLKALMEDHALKNACDHMEIVGRRGWNKVLDLEPKAILLIKDLNVGGSNA